MYLQHIFDGGVYKVTGIGTKSGKLVGTVLTPGGQEVIARGSRRGNTVQLRQKGDLWIVLYI